MKLEDLQFWKRRGRLRQAFRCRTRQKHEKYSNDDLEDNSGELTRIINLNEPQSDRFSSNEISTSKYTFLLFLPKFLFEQFRKYSNIFFAFIVFLQQLNDVSPTGRFTTLVPLVLILIVSACKEIMEDWKRHIQDGKINNSKILVYRNGIWDYFKWKDIEVGDFVKCQDGHLFPADLLLISSSEPNGVCYVQTANLDGETNLKIRQAVDCTSKCLTISTLKQLQGRIECEAPNRHLYEFCGTIYLKQSLHEEEVSPLGPNQILLRGSQLKNTSWIYAIVLYTGHESKLMMNSRRVPSKRSNMEKMTNKLIIFLFFILLLMSVISATVNFALKTHEHWYLALSNSTKTSVFLNILTFIILYNNLIPISLQVTLEVVKYFQAQYINSDTEMKHMIQNHLGSSPTGFNDHQPNEQNVISANARTSNLNEELGQVKYIFSDKTGTLTENVMKFRQCTVAGLIYGTGDSEFSSYELRKALKLNNEMSEMTDLFITLLISCHTIIPEKKAYFDNKDIGGDINYQASSPDEEAIVDAMRMSGFVFRERNATSLLLDFLQEKRRYELLNIVEFTSDRKRMTVILRENFGGNRILLFCKGADSIIFERLSSKSKYLEDTKEHLEQFAKFGLRTLCCAYKELSEEIYEKWNSKYMEAAVRLDNREEHIEKCADEIERNLELLGGTGIEDRLQDGVGKCISNLLEAEINLWVLTGDKRETAINIGYSTQLLQPSMHLLSLQSTSKDDCLQQILEMNNKRRNQMSSIESPNNENLNVIKQALIVDGSTLKYCLSTQCRQDFLNLVIDCATVICCRVSPMQKAEMVELVKKNTEAITLAIGDGANDVGMIQAANVGVGITGNEGMQAACASDYTIAQFRFLERLLFVHGAWSYWRLAKVILYSFYKNVTLYVIELWFAIHSAFSGQIVFDRWSIAIYNVVFTATLPLTLGLLDRICSDKTMLRFPQLYRMSQNHTDFNYKVFWQWIIQSLLHSLMLFYLTYFFLLHDMEHDGTAGGLLYFGNYIYTYTVVVVCVKAGLVTNSWTWPNLLAFAFSIVSWFLFLIIYSMIWPSLTFLGADMARIGNHIYMSTQFWAGLLLIPCATLLVDFVASVIQRSLFKTLAQEVQESELAQMQSGDMERAPLFRKLTKFHNMFKKSVQRSDQTSNIGQNDDGTTYRGYAFSQVDDGPVKPGDVIRMYDTTSEKPQGL
ncbi:hypothetical protein SNEBB_010321 [Seison nebaliae]|nr:hypothetical protein SNEBB_010321 [Seison nebaliae]